MIKRQIKDLEEVVWELKLSYHSIVDDADPAQLAIN